MYHRKVSSQKPEWFSCCFRWNSAQVFLTWKNEPARIISFLSVLWSVATYMFYESVHEEHIKTIVFSTDIWVVMYVDVLEEGFHFLLCNSLETHWKLDFGSSWPHWKDYSVTEGKKWRSRSDAPGVFVFRKKLWCLPWLVGLFLLQIERCNIRCNIIILRIFDRICFAFFPCVTDVRHKPWKESAFFAGNSFQKVCWRKYKFSRAFRTCSSVFPSTLAQRKHFSDRWLCASFAFFF